MGDKVKVNLTISKEIVEKAKKIGLNISQFCENALKDAIERLEQPKTEANGNGPFLSEGSFGKESSWCGRRDLNPGRQRGRLMS